VFITATVVDIMPMNTPGINFYKCTQTAIQTSWST